MASGCSHRYIGNSVSVAIDSSSTVSHADYTAPRLNCGKAEEFAGAAWKMPFQGRMRPPIARP